MKKFNAGDRVIVRDCGHPFPGVVLGYTKNCFGVPLIRVRLDDCGGFETVWYEHEVQEEV